MKMFLKFTSQLASFKLRYNMIICVLFSALSLLEWNKLFVPVVIVQFHEQCRLGNNDRKGRSWEAAVV